MNSDFTAIVREDNEVHILKCKIIDKDYLYFQMYNKTKDVLLPMFKIKADFGRLNWIKPTAFQKKMEREAKLTKNVDRDSLIGYYHQFKLQFLVGKYHAK